MIELTTKEHLIYFLQSGSFRLNKTDLKFVQNLLDYTVNKKPITTNQVSLFDHIVKKYNRQLKKYNITNELANSLPWASVIVSSDIIHTTAQLSIADNKIFFKAPFNKSFISDHRKISMSPFVWVKEQKHYASEYSTRALKIITRLAIRHYEVVNFCPTATILLNKIQEYDNAKHWKPTLVNVNGIYLISAINESLAEAIKDIPLNNNPKTLATLADYGVEIDDSIINGNVVLEIASKKYCEVNINDIDLVINALIAIECDVVVRSGELFFKEIKNEFFKKLMPSIPSLTIANNDILNKYKYPVAIQFASAIFTSITPKKTIKIINTNPIKIT